MRRIFACLLAVLCMLSPLPTKAEDVSVSAASAVLIEASTGQVLYEKDAHTPRSMASTTKLMTALVAADCGDWERTVTVTAPMVAVEGSALGLRAGDTLTLRDTVCGMLLVSGNDAANAVALTLSNSLPEFAQKMNAKATAIGMKHSQFVTPSGLDAEGHAATAYDMALLGAAVLRDPVLAEISAKKSDTIRINDRTVTVSNHNRLLSLYPGTVGGKTGFTKKSGRCLVSAATRDGVTLVAVTLKAGDDWNDHMALFDYGFSRLQAVEWPKSDLPPLPVTGGKAPAMPLAVKWPAPLILPAGEEHTVSMTVHLPRFLFAPVAAGEKVGEVRYTLNGKLHMVVDIAAAEEIKARPTAGREDRFFEYLRLLWAGLTG